MDDSQYELWGREKLTMIGLPLHFVERLPPFPFRGSSRGGVRSKVRKRKMERNFRPSSNHMPSLIGPAPHYRMQVSCIFGLCPLSLQFQKSPLYVLPLERERTEIVGERISEPYRAWVISNHLQNYGQD